MATAATTTTGTMTDHIARLYALALGSLVFLVAWAVVAANPFPEAKAASDPRLVALQNREARLAREQRRVDRLVARRFAAYERELDRRRLQAPASAPAASAAPTAPAAPAQVTSLPPVTSSESS